MSIRIALAGNPNSGKTTLFNALTGSNQFVGNWPGVTVEKKEGKLKSDRSITITDLPGIYSLSPYTLEEVVARNYLLEERPDVILNIIDGTNLERNLFLTTQLAELGIPVVVAVNMMDVVLKNGDKINLSCDKTIIAKVVGEREVGYLGYIYKLTPLTRKIMEEIGKANKSGAYRGAQYWCYRGTRLSDIQDVQ